MKNNKNKLIKLLVIFSIITIILPFGMVYAENDVKIEPTPVEYSEKYKQWLELDEEERKKTLEPRKYDVVKEVDNTTYLKNMTNVFKMQQLAKASLPTKYNLLDDIPENLLVRDQMDTNSCWAFATIGALESTLALRDKNALSPTIEYDFSERHMEYAISKYTFLNNQVNKYGYVREIGEGGNFFQALTYLTNGLGAVEESSMPFENNQENIDISQIQNKEVTTTIYDTKEFENSSLTEKEQLMQSMKEYIVNYGAIYAGIRGASLTGSNSYNNETGAIYCKNSIMEKSDHAVIIIGWDDDYAKENFNENQRPESNGAWIIKNSWGDFITYNLMEEKQVVFEEYTDECISNGWNSAEQIPDELILTSYKESFGESKVTIQGEDIVIEIGNEGYMYVSYEDCNVYDDLATIEKATYSKDYDNVYQNDTLGFSNSVQYMGQGTLSLANVFQRDSSVQEEIDKVSIYSLQEYEYKVLVNPNGSSKSPEDLIEVQLKEGDTQTVGAGYHMLEFAEPIELTGDSFVVVLQIVSDKIYKKVYLESNISDTPWSEAVVNEGESFIAYESGFSTNQWEDLATYEDESLRGNLCIKAYTNEVEETEINLTEIYINQSPNKTVYQEGENFDKTGMVVIAKYSDGTEKEITNYEITGGENLTLETTEIVISYTENGITKTITQEITVNQGEETVTLTEIYINQSPNKTVYQEGENFDKTGMVVIAKYSDGTEKEITNYEIIGGENLTVNTNYITIRYTENGTIRNTTQEITVNAEQTNDPETPNRQPVLSDFDNSKTEITETKLYFSSTDLSNSNGEVTIKITGIELGDESNSYEHYYYLSGTQGDENITNWKKTEITKESDGTYSITINIKSQDLENYQELIESDNLFLYIKEIASIDNNQAENIVTLDVQNNSEAECYVDGKYVGGIEDVLNYNKNQNNSNGKEDDTTASGKLPYTGRTILIIAFLIVIVSGAFAYHRYKHIDR